MKFSWSTVLQHSVAFTFAAAVAGFTLAAHAEYLCKEPPTQADRKACELARQDSPAALIHFIERTNAVYHLYLPDYVSDADAARWELARNAKEPQAATDFAARDSSTAGSK
jgi:hypothetical protein